MSLSPVPAAALLQQLHEFDTVIDARSEGEFAEDHLPGAVNWPTLNNDQRRDIGTLYKQVNAFEAKKRGAAHAARNIAGHIEREVIDKPKDWKPLAYCWRGGKRSGSLSLVLDQIGFKATLVEGGYKALRAALVLDIPQRVSALNWRVICGTTGSGKTLTSFKTAQLATMFPYIDKVLFVVDRKDLDYQTIKEYDRFEKGAANSNTSTRILQKQLESSDARIIITTIQKLDKFIKQFE